VQERNRTRLALLATSHGMNHVYQLLTPIIIPEITADYGLSYFTAGVLLSCFLLSYSLLPVLSGYLSQVFGRRRLLTLGFVISALSFLAMGFMDNIIIFALLLFVAGAGGSTYHPNGVPFLAETYQDNRGKTFGLHQTGGAMGAFIAPILTGVLVLNFSWRPTLMLLAIPGLILAALLWFSISPEQTSNKNRSQTSKIGVSKMELYGSVLLFIGAAFIYVLGQRGTDSFANLYFTRSRGIENFLEASLLFSTLKVAGLFSAPLCGKLSDMFDRKKVLIILVIVGSASLCVITATPTILLAIPCIIFGFAASGLLAVGDTLLADITPQDQMTVIFGINATVSFTSALVISPLLGIIADQYSFDVGFILLSVLMPLSIPLLLKIKTKPAQQKQCPPRSE
jgi:FSR family fosmidomycin resistance protein-like MFS transporter